MTEDLKTFETNFKQEIVNFKNQKKMQTKQVKLNRLPAFINNLAKKGLIVTKTVKNGNYNKGETFEPYVLVEWCTLVEALANRDLYMKQALK